MDDLLQSSLRCPQCRAAVRPDAPWCSQCYTDLRPAPASAPAAALPIPPTASYGPPALDPLIAAPELLGLPGLIPVATPDPTWPCATCGAGNPLAASACTACGAGFLAGLREAEGPLLELPGVGDLTRLSRAQRLGLAGGVVLTFVVLTALLGLLLS